MRIEKEFINILDTFSGADGAIRFTKLKFYLENIAKEENEAARSIEDVVIRFSRLIDVVNK